MLDVKKRKGRKRLRPRSTKVFKHFRSTEMIQIYNAVTVVKSVEVKCLNTFCRFGPVYFHLLSVLKPLKEQIIKCRHIIL